MSSWRFSWNAGMLAAMVLLLAGGALMFGAGEGSTLLHHTGFGLVVLAGVVYLVARIALFLRERRGG